MQNEHAVSQLPSLFEPREWIRQRQETLQRIEEKYQELINKNSSFWDGFKSSFSSKENVQVVITEYILPMLECVQADEKPISFIVELIEKHNKDIESFLQEGKQLTELTNAMAKYIKDLNQFLEDSRSMVNGTVDSLHALDQEREQDYDLKLSKYAELFAQFKEQKKTIDSLSTDIIGRVDRQKQIIEKIRSESELHGTTLADLKRAIPDSLKSRLVKVESTANHLQVRISCIDENLKLSQEEFNTTKKELEKKADKIETQKELERLAAQLQAQLRRMHLLFWFSLLFSAGFSLISWFAQG